MRLMTVHSDFIEIEPLKQAIKNADEITEKQMKIDEALVCFISIEKKDETAENIATRVKKEILDICKKVQCSRVVVYPLVHLTSNPSSPLFAKKTLNQIYNELKKDIEAYKAPFGWYKAYTLKCKGHPLSELSREFDFENKTNEKQDEDVSESLKQEDKVNYEHFIIDVQGNITPVSEFNFEKFENLKKLVDYEVKKQRIYAQEPIHVKLMKEQELVDYEPGSDSGNLRWYPKGKLIKKILEEYISRKYHEYGAMEVETPLMYDFEHPALKSYLNRFPARHYTLKSDDKKYFLRFAACFGQFLMSHDFTISYKNLPLKMFEMTRYSFRREQSGELVGLKRLRAFTMPDMHTLCADMESAKEQFKEQYYLSKQILEELNVFDKTEIAFRVEKKFFEQNIEWYKDYAKRSGKPIFIETYDKMYAYFITKFEFNFIDASNKASALSTVQIDIENSKNYDIVYVDKDGEKKRPLILHASLSGAVERDLYAILEKQGMDMKKGEKAMFPFFLSPTQIRIIPISQDFLEISKKIADEIEKKDIRVDIDDREESLSKRIRFAQKEWVPFIVVIGEKEAKSMKFSIRKRTKEKDETIEADLNELVEILKKEQGNFMTYKLTMPRLLSKRPIIYSK